MPAIRNTVITLGTILLIAFSSGCQKNQSTDPKTEQTSATEEKKATAASEEKPIDPKMVTKPGEPMTAERYQAVKARLKQIGLAMHNFADQNRTFLPSVEEHPEYYDENGRLKVSWRVHLLPFLEQKKLYGQFKLDEAWDSPHNALLAKNMPDAFRSPDTPAGSDKTRFRVFEGTREENQQKEKAPTTMFPLGTPLGFRDILDGTSNTVMAVEVGPDKAVEWTKPGGLNIAHPRAEFGDAARGIPVLIGDGSIICFKRDIDDVIWKALIGPDDETRIDWRDIEIKHSTLSAKQSQLLNQLKQIVVAFFNYHETFQRFPPAEKDLVDGKPNLSWRVHLLPFLDQKKLYDQFKLDEAWDSPHNKTLLDQMPDLFQFNPQVKPGATQVMTFSGENTPFPGGLGPRIRDITDGTSNTIFFVIAGPDKAVPWTKPEDLAFDPADPAQALGKLSSPAYVAVMMDGSIRSVPVNLPAKTLVKLIQPADGMIVDVELKPYRPQ
ncbi:DUF1559 family PulG-like putative transporter [Gimesia algae]|uniref:DUF1559 domain-containing protein n=1 Tax=Gimesia algae TaxID=2527971 RepID=A0A517VFJ0_9PLAN|nr:DUF1559 domain-containing protein [Gimesia algae]QDT91771.1 hypothetical protein Pan161_34340 [Gimesia algae]